MSDLAVFLVTFVIGWVAFLVVERVWLNRRRKQ